MNLKVEQKDTRQISVFDINHRYPTKDVRPFHCKTKDTRHKNREKRKEKREKRKEKREKRNVLP